MSKKDAEDDIITRVETILDNALGTTVVTLDEQVEEDLPDEYELYIQEKEQLDEEYDLMQVVKSLAFS